MHMCTDKKDVIIKLIIDTVKEVTGKDISSPDINLLGREIGIIPVDFLYIFDILEKSLNKNICSLIENSHYTIMTPNNLADAICTQ